MVKYLDTLGHEVTYEELENEWIELNDWNDALGVERERYNLDYEVNRYINRLIERGKLEFEVWD